MSEALAPTSSPPSYEYSGAIDPQRPYMTPEVWGGSYGDGGGSMAGVGAGTKKEEGGHSYPPVYGDRMEAPPSTAGLVSSPRSPSGREDEYGRDIGGDGMGRGRAHAPSSSEVYRPLEDGEKGWAM